MNKITHLILVVGFSLALASCGGKDTVEPPEALPVVFENEAAPEPEDVPEPAIPHFADTMQVFAFIDSSGHKDLYDEGIIRDIARSSVAYADSLINNPHERFIIVDKGDMRVRIFDRYGRPEKSYRMACARHYGTKRRKADGRTPEGYFTVQGVYDSTDWLFTDDEGNTSKVKGQFGPRFIRLRTPVSSQIGIHGTGSPWTMGHRVSHGCIRITNDNILELVDLVTPGMPVIVVPGLLDIRQNESEENPTVWIPSRKGKTRPVPRPAQETECPTDTPNISPDSLPLAPESSPADSLRTDTISERPQSI